MKHYDLIIIGGGMVGASLAAVLKDRAFNIALIDAETMNAEDHRLIALNDASVCLFKNCGIWPYLQPYASPIKEVHVSQKNRFGATRIPASLLNLEALGYVVPAKWINKALAEVMADAENIDVIRPARLISLEQNDEGVTITLSHETSVLSAKKLVGADGSYSTVRKLLDIVTDEFDYEQTALVTATQLNRDHEGIAYERFLKSGAIAMLPLTDHRAATIWTAGQHEIADLMQLSDEAFLDKLQKEFGYRLGKLLSIEKRATYPLKMITAKSHQKNHVCLLGNAAHTLHPIASQGLNLALYEVAVYATALLENNPAILEHLHQQTFSQNLSHKLAGLFSSDFFVLNQARQFGLMGLDVLSGLKKRFAKNAIGKGGYIPPIISSITSLIDEREVARSASSITSPIDEREVARSASSITSPIDEREVARSASSITSPIDEREVARSASSITSPTCGRGRAKRG